MRLGRQTREGAGAASNVLLILGILVLVQYLSYRHPKEWDLTKNKRLSLSSLSTQLLSKLNRDLDLWVFVSAGDTQTRDLIHQYETASSRVKAHTIDPVARPQEARTMGINTLPPVVVVSYGEKREQVTQPSEERLTNAINRVTSGVERVVYFLQGHGEPDPAASELSALKEAIVAENYKVKTLSLLTEKKIPADLLAIVIVNPRYPLLAGEKKVIENYLKQGGHALFLAGPDLHPSWSGFLRLFGFELLQNLVTDPHIVAVGAGPEYLFVNTYPPHPVTEPFQGRGAPPAVFPLARSIVKTSKPPRDLTYTPIAQTSKMARAFSVKIAGKKIVPESKKPSQTGVLDVAAAVSSALEEKPLRLVVIGSASFLDSQWLSNFANRDLALNILSWLSESKNTIAIRPKSPESQSLFLDLGNTVRILLVSLVGIPAFGVVLGVSNWLRRRNL